ncbi:MAG: hypothetical protein J6V99_04890 [Neisseriaceae bacterium]|nr:hypothetical protein [Neisseriaceae bacterium]
MASLVVSTIYFGLMGLLAGFFLLLALVFPKRFKKIKIAFAVMSVGVLLWFLVVIPVWARVSLKIAEEKKRPIREAAEKRYNEARAVFDEQCKKAGEKIYRTVDNVDGVMLLKIRQSPALHLNDPLFEDAVVAAIDNTGHDYIGTFLQGWFDPHYKGYSFVDVLNEDGSIKRYLDYKEYASFIQDQDGVVINPDNPARYVVTYENNVNPELRKHWVAGTTIKIIDRQTDELLAEKTIFAFARTMGNYSHGAWVDSRMDTCPDMEELGRKFTAQFAMAVLKP